LSTPCVADRGAGQLYNAVLGNELLRSTVAARPQPIFSDHQRGACAGDFQTSFAV
jgi:hypothetical protein